MSSRKYPNRTRTFHSDTLRLDRFYQLTRINPNNQLVDPNADHYCLFLDDFAMKGCYFCYQGYCYLKSQTSCPRTHDPELNPHLKPIHLPIQSIPNVSTWEGIQL